jgi:ATP-dependent DNA helicase PIF1
MTVHKSEGQTLQRVGLYLPDPVFSHGMLYTAMSRTTTRDGITILLGANQKPPDADEGYYTANVVYRNVLK